jgi:hypothetical protein
MGQTAEELRAQLGQQRAEVSRDLDAIGDHIIPSRIMQRRTSAARQRFTDMKERVMGVAESSVDEVRHLGEAGTETVTGSVATAVHGTRSAAEGNPLAMGLVAFGAGLVAATVFPASRTERQLAQQAQPALEKAASEVGPAVSHVVEEMKPAAQEAVADLKDAGKEAVAAVKEEASSAATEAKSDATEAMRQVKGGGAPTG